LACLCAAAAFAAPAGAGPLRTAIMDLDHFGNPDAVERNRAFARTDASGASFVRLVLTWRSVANAGEPADATDPCDPAYNWGWFDDQVRSARAKGLKILATVQGAPDFAQAAPAHPDGIHKPDPADFADFARAAARRYNNTNPCGDGTLPAIRYWQAWNEPNRDYFFMPQRQGDTLVSPGLYRKLVNAFANAVHNVSGKNRVVAGGLAPLGKGRDKPAPLPFMRKLLSKPVRFDIWSHHAYTSGGPTHRAPGEGNIALGDLGDMRKVLKANDGRIVSKGKVQFWITEISWDTNGPDPKAVPMKLHARWTSEALYRAWRHGVSLVTWFRIQDDPLYATPYQSGFFTVNEKRKLSFQAFRFPFVAFRQPGRMLVWGRTPTSTGGTVAIQRVVNGAWRTVATVRASSSGIFTKRFSSRARSGYVRAVYKGQKSLGFSLTPVPDRYVNPFGCGGPIAC
jgi:hypothetical protein